MSLEVSLLFIAVPQVPIVYPCLLKCCITVGCMCCTPFQNINQSTALNWRIAYIPCACCTTQIYIVQNDFCRKLSEELFCRYWGMQGKKDYSEKLFTQFQLSEHVPKENFYRRLKAALDLSFLRERTQGYCGICGQKSIDPVVFMKLMLVGYLENIISDRKLMQHCAMRLDILYFL